MREIKFRAWHPEEKKMWQDVGMDGYGGIILDTQHMGLKPLKGNAILMQYTGLKDKNGKNIYEGDIVKFRYNRQDKIGQIAYGTCGFWVVGWLDMLDRPFHWPIEVIGNIYENPELIDIQP